MIRTRRTTASLAGVFRNSAQPGDPAEAPAIVEGAAGDPRAFPGSGGSAATTGLAQAIAALGGGQHQHGDDGDEHAQS